MTALASDDRHVVTRVVDELSADVSGLVGVSLWSMDAAETASTLVALTRLSAQVAELELRVAAHAERIRVEDASGATSAASWWAHVTRLTRRTAQHRMALARALDTGHEPVRDAFAAGAVVLEQAEVIVRAVAELPDDVGPANVARAESELVALAGEHDAKRLRVLGRRILDVVASEVAEAQEARLLAREERAAQASARFTMADDGHGRVHGRFTLPAAQGAMLRTALTALAAPRHLAAHSGGGGGPMPSAQRLATPERLGQAFAEYVERFPTDHLPSTGGVNATIVVTIPLSTLQAGAGAGTLDTGEPITADQARRLACEAAIIPVVLGGNSQVLDLGRRRRLHTRAQRIALALRDRGCTAEGCDWPPALCHAHHDHPWSHGGPTNLINGRLLCPRHHTRIHDPTYQTTHLPNGKITFTRRT
ncbi:DUF222 domain-containing protein [Nocardioides sp.]|uniref:HNH endonuclease signature motif containing protein n=1 Tax=Nocardioides sp. TaxID=35761 RepID=UPI003D141F28